jgi:tryptophanyl-tRNA synthetase
MSKKVLVSGIQSSGRLHIGNYFGAIKQNVELGNSGEYESYIFIADYHSMTTLTDPKERLENTFDAACTYLACGLDPSRVALFKQSDIPSHTELAWVLNTVTPMPMLMLSHAFKSQVAKNTELVKQYLDPTKFTEQNDNHYFILNSLYQNKNNNSVALNFNTPLDLIVDPKESNTFNKFLIYNFNDDQKSLLSLVNEINEKMNSGINIGLFDYPVLMASDILMYNANIVPVGKDQEQHIEIAREIAGKFNRAYEEVFAMPQAHIVKDVATVPGIDGTKMSKSKGNHIPLFGTDEEIKKLVMSIKSDSARPEDTKNPDESAIYQIHRLFLNKEEDEQLRKKFEDGGYGYKEAKEKCAEAIISFVSPMREKYNHYKSNRDEVMAILEEGKKKAESRSKEMMEKVRSVTGLQ